MMDRRELIRKVAVSTLEKEMRGGGRPDVMELGLSLESNYYDYFGERFPPEARGKGCIATMCRCIIDGKPYDPTI